MKYNINQSWYNIYNPKTLDDLILDDIIINRFKNFIKTNTMTNMIIMGIPGIGKSCTINVIVKKILGSYYSQGLMKISLNDKSLENINDILIGFGKKLLKDENQNNIIKIVLIEEADNFTEKAQIIINNIMEEYDNIKFIFICNNINNIIENIQSKSIIFNFGYIDSLNDKIKKRLEYILNSENIKYNEESINYLILLSKGDIRKCINYLECIAYGLGEITIDNIKKICTQPESTIIGDIINTILQKNFKLSVQKIDNLLNAGYNTNDIILFMIEYISNVNGIAENIRIKSLDILNLACINVNENISSKLQLYNTIIKLLEI
jgi:DNA polymerase III delta prime subunit